MRTPAEPGSSGLGSAADPELSESGGPSSAPRRRSLVFLGPSLPSEQTAEGEPKAIRPLLHEGLPLQVGTDLPLVRCRSPWSAQRDTERIIVGSHPARADVLLSGVGIHPEHVRLYLPSDPGAATDLLVIRPGSTRLEERPVEPREWAALRGGEILELGPWRFRYLVTTPSGDGPDRVMGPIG